MWWELYRVFFYTIPIGVMVFVVLLGTSAVSNVLGKVMRIALGPMSRWSRLAMALMVFVCSFSIFLYVSIQRIANDLFEVSALGEGSNAKFIVFDDKYVYVVPIVRAFSEVLVEQQAEKDESLSSCRDKYWSDRSFRIRPCIEAIGDPRISKAIANRESYLGPISDNNLAVHLENTHFLLIFKSLDFMLIQQALIGELTAGLPFLETGIGDREVSFQLRTSQKEVRAHLDRFSTYSFCLVLFFSTWCSMIFFGDARSDDDEDDDDFVDFESIDA